MNNSTQSPNGKEGEGNPLTLTTESKTMKNKRFVVYGVTLAVAMVILGTQGGSAMAPVWMLAAFCAYFLPSIVGAVRKADNEGSIFVINSLLGWTVIGWVVALALAAKDVRGVKKA